MTFFLHNLHEVNNKALWSKAQKHAWNNLHIRGSSPQDFSNKNILQIF